MDIDLALSWILKIAASWALVAIPYSLAKGHAVQQRSVSTRSKFVLYVQHVLIACVFSGLVWFFYDIDGKLVDALADAKRNSFGLAVLTLTTLSAIIGLNKGFTTGRLRLPLAVATLRNEERKKLEEMVEVTVMALQRETNPVAKRELEQALAEARQALEEDRRSWPLPS